MKHFYLILLMLLGLTNCSVYEDGFKCPIGEGESCKSLSFVDNKVDQGDYSELEQGKTLKNQQHVILFYPQSNQRMDLKISDAK